jgi:RecA/RadA recombinase
MERSYDANWAKSFGVDIDSLIYVATKTAEETFDTVIKLCKEKVADLIVLDSLHGMSPHGEQYSGKADKERSLTEDTMALLARKLSQFFRIATPYVSESKCAVLLIGQSRMDLSSFIKMETLSGGHALMHNSRLILRLRRGQKVDGEFEKIETEDVDEKGKPILEKIQTGFSLVVHVDKSQVKDCVEGNEINTIFNYKTGIKE